MALGSRIVARTASRWALHGCLLTSVACGPAIATPTAQTEASSGAPVASTGTTTPATTLGGPDSTDTTMSVDGTSTTSGEDVSTSTTTGAPSCLPSCPVTSECNDGVDNDADGLVDTDDPECVALCHDDEGSTYHGLPAGGGGCRRDCYFDDNRGQGDDACAWHLSCDPLGPGEYWQCFPDPTTPDCDTRPSSPDCPSACLPMTLPGCDCFGCCTFSTPGGPEDRWLEHPDCTVDDPSACPPCTKNPLCLNDCDDPCEWCFGEPTLPEGCAQATCDDGTACSDHCDCEPGRACILGCCRPGVVGG